MTLLSRIVKTNSIQANISNNWADLLAIETDNCFMIFQ